MKTILEDDSRFVCEINALCFQMLSQDELTLIRNSKTQVLFRKGDNITKQGVFASYVLFVINGLSKQYIEGYNNKSHNLRIIGPGEFIGLSSVFSANVFQYSVTSLTDSHCFLIEKEAIATVMQTNAKFTTNIVKRYCLHNSNLYETIGSVLYKQMNGRMASALLYLNQIKNDHPDIFTLLTRKEVSEFAGVSTENGIKLLKTFEKDGLIKLPEKDILLLNKTMLAEIAKHG
ncbi:MAG: hypothetical protein A2X19_08165 [Bacteroidetes bacterium GWE2_39_28]|nr:MAG: hypothetical protein A2X19_08165 [Bacteroidetes bacterium GWE2_39_28]OFY13254.1 MAG: hypothetical protein A2X16_05000 [Bacteroidetes bacterium GWF2_39_10]OFZ08684.1 MAG: hypothetical protein A2322_07380 [Bacteroidetes bacterium RIFOXYB2_FULL_39_7]OFZ11459.1 MAG: hypothetical protein A2465_04285 [Bacteroidetes bacterium RIFOXYC2_FULL_39_11]HCT94295.1 Crp/Fnr family transcriptional regulator [Rikenellaceae bacterium]